MRARIHRGSAGREVPLNDARRRASYLRLAALLGTVLLGTVLLVATGAGVATAGDPPTPGTGTVAAPNGSVGAAGAIMSCEITDDRLDELSGLVADGPRWWAIADGGREARAIALDGCAVTGIRSAPIDPSDVEDLALGPDGALWLADIGDNGGSRDSVALIVLPRSGPPRLHRLVYPDGPRDAEALVVTDDGVPVVITKSAGEAVVHRPAGPLSDEGTPTPLVRAGTIVLPASGTVGGPLGSLGSRTVTGAALSPVDSAAGRVVAVRTYTDAWLFRLPPGGAATADAVVRALGGAPVPIALPDEPQGEAVALGADGTLLTGTESRDGRPAGVRVLPGAAAAALAPDAPAVAQPDIPPPSSAPAVPAALIGAAAVVAVLVLLAVAMTVQARRRR